MASAPPTGGLGNDGGGPFPLLSAISSPYCDGHDRGSTPTEKRQNPRTIPSVFLTFSRVTHFLCVFFSFLFPLLRGNWQIRFGLYAPCVSMPVVASVRLLNLFSFWCFVARTLLYLCVALLSPACSVSLDLLYLRESLRGSGVHKSSAQQSGTRTRLENNPQRTSKQTKPKCNYGKEKSFSHRDQRNRCNLLSAGSARYASQCRG